MNFSWPNNSSPRRTLKYLFLAEGDAEVGFLNAYLKNKQRNSAETGVYCFKGLQRIGGHNTVSLRKVLSLSLDSISDLHGIGLIADAEAEPENRLEAVIALFKELGFPKCAKDILAGGRHQTGNQRIGVSFSPNLKQSGRIEDLVVKEVAEWQHSKHLNSYAEGTGIANERKAICGTYIATRKPDLCGLGRAFEAGVLDVTNSAYELHRDLIDFVCT